MVRVAVCLQGDLADCFYIVESGQVRITMKRSRVGCKNDRFFFQDKSFSGVSYVILFLFLSWTDEKRAGRGGGRYCNVLSGPVLWGAGARHQQASSCVCLCCWKRQMLGYVSCYFGLFRTSGMLMWELSVQTQCLTFWLSFLLFSGCFLFQVMDVKAFERLLGPCMDIMKRNIANYEEQLESLFGSSTEIEQQSS